MKEIKTDKYNFEQYSDENLLYKNSLIDPVKLSNGITRLYGESSEMFPLLTMTEGNNGMKPIKKKLNDTQYTWDTMGLMKYTSDVVGLADSSNTQPGIGFSTFRVTFEDRLIIRYHTVTSPDKKYICRAQGHPTVTSDNKYMYTFIIMTGDPDAYVSLDNFTAGSSWVLGISKVSSTKSDGVTSNSMAPGKWTNQFSFSRFGKEITGNIANKVVNVQFDTVKSDGSKGAGKSLWFPFEMKMFELSRRFMLEDDLWTSVYNRDSYGRLHNRDEESSQAVPSGAGIKDMLESTGQYDTYGTLTLAKVKSVITNLFTNRVDNTPMEIVLYTGSGGMSQFHNAVMNDAISNGYLVALGEQEIMNGTDGHLRYGKYFNQFKTIDGHTLTVKKAKNFDNGKLALLDRANGKMYDGYPEESYNMVILDHSIDSGTGERNIQLVAEEGREILTGVYKGMTPLPAEWGAFERNGVLSTRKDEASYEVFVSQGIAMLNWTTSYLLKFQR